MVFGQEAYIGDSKLSLVNALTSVPIALVSKQDGAGGSFEGGLRGRIGAGFDDAGEDGRGTSLGGGGRCQCDTVC
jgi:hypothetical protein